jgi:hypothetical protein
MIGDKVLPTSTTILLDYDNAKRHPSLPITYYGDDMIENLSPDKIDSRDFWKASTYLFPLFSICGGEKILKTIQEANDGTFSTACGLGVIKPINDYYVHEPNFKILEIGPGYGGFHSHIKDLCGTDENYYGIDVNPLYKYERLFKTTGKTIPNKVPNNLDIVYSMNVFQHLSKTQRKGYYTRIHKKLKKGGVFVFGMFVETEKNKDWNVWGTKDFNGRNYCYFFRQLTIVDREDELLSELSEIGFEVEKLNPYEGYTHYLTFKCTKL